LIGLPSSEVPAVEIARGDLIQVTPTSYGVHSEAFHFWSGPEGHPTEYENYAESTMGRSDIPTIEEQEETRSVKSVDEAKTFPEAIAIQRVADTGDTVFTVPITGP
jgi:6-phosphofructo-2-kinase/fructose-2,6-biphosphatase 4